MPAPKVLLVEDNDADVQICLRVFRQNPSGCEIDVVRDGEAVLAHLKGIKDLGKTENLPSVILLDLHLPKVDGLEVLKQLKEDAVLKLIPVVVLSTSKRALDIEQSYERGAASYFAKPVDFEEFSVMMNTFINYWTKYAILPFQIEV